MSTHDDDTCPHLVVLGRLEAENARLKAEVERLGKAIMDSVEMRQRLREIENGNQSK